MDQSREMNSTLQPRQSFVARDNVLAARDTAFFFASPPQQPQALAQQYPIQQHQNVQLPFGVSRTGQQPQLPVALNTLSHSNPLRAFSDARHSSLAGQHLSRLQIPQHQAQSISEIRPIAHSVNSRQWGPYNFNSNVQNAAVGIRRARSEANIQSQSNHMMPTPTQSNSSDPQPVFQSNMPQHMVLARTGNGFALSRPARNREWMAKSDPPVHLASLDDHRRQQRGREEFLVGGMQSGRNMCFVADDQQDDEKRLLYNTRIRRGRSNKGLGHYPNPEQVAVPAGTTLQQMCLFFPLHCWGEGLRIFCAENWDAKMIFDHWPDDLKATFRSGGRRWNSIQQAMGREQDRMAREDGRSVNRGPARRRRARQVAAAGVANAGMAAVGGGGVALSIAQAGPVAQVAPITQAATEQSDSVEEEISLDLDESMEAGTPYSDESAPMSPEEYAAIASFLQHDANLSQY